MQQLLSPETFEFFARYLLAGYVVIIVRSRFATPERPKATELVVEAVILSLVTQVAYKAILWGLPDSWHPQGEAALFSEVLGVPLILGIVFGLNVSRGWNDAVLRRLSMPFSEPTRKAYDFAFSQDNRDPCFVILSYGDGTQVAGYYGVNSMAANDPDHSDLYLERVYTVGDDGLWSEPNPQRSALLSLTDVRSIEFLDTED